MSPKICFERWGEIPGDHPEAIPAPSWQNDDKKFLQSGFYLVNDGGAAYNIRVESFEIERSRSAISKSIPRIAEKGTGFALVWLDGYSGLMRDGGKWDLAGAMERAGQAKYGNPIYRPDFSVPVSVICKDGEGLEYRTKQQLTFIRSQGRLVFGSPTFERVQEESSGTECLRNSINNSSLASEVRSDSSASFTGQPEIQVAGPDEVRLAIYPAPNRYKLGILGGSPIRPTTDCLLWSIHNQSLRSFPKIGLEISSSQSFDERKSVFREPINLGFQWPLISNLGAGDQTGPSTFLRAEGDDLYLGNSEDILPWPNGDKSVIRRWRLIMKMTGLSEEWLIELEVWWTLSTKTLELMECSTDSPSKAERHNATTGPSAEETTSTDNDNDAPAGAAATARNPESLKPAKVQSPDPDKGNLDILRSADGNFKRAVTLDVARRFGGVTRRAIDEAIRKDKLRTEGRRQQRRVLVESLLQYFPPEK